MPSTEFVCPKCGVTARSQNQLAPGTAIRCPSCQFVFRLGGGSDSPVPSARPATARPAAQAKPTPREASYADAPPPVRRAPAPPPGPTVSAPAKRMSDDRPARTYRDDDQDDRDDRPPTGKP